MAAWSCSTGNGAGGGRARVGGTDHSRLRGSGWRWRTSDDRGGRDNVIEAVAVLHAVVLGILDIAEHADDAAHQASSANVVLDEGEAGGGHREVGQDVVVGRRAVA